MTAPAAAPGTGTGTGSRARLWALLLLAPPLSMVAQLWQAGAAPDGADLQCAADVIRKGWSEGDVVRFDPVWAHEGWPAINDLTVQELPADDADRVWAHRRLWVLASLFARGRTDWPEGWSVQARTDCGDAEIVRLSLPDRGAPLYDFEQGLPEAQMSMVQDGPGERLRYPAGPWINQDPPRLRCRIYENLRHSCVPGHSWNWVGPIRRDVDDVVRSALWAHPPVGGHKLDIVYPKVPLGRSMEVEGGFTLAAARSPAGTPVHFEVYVDGRRLLERTVGVDEKGWMRWRLDTADVSGTTAQVRFRVYAEDNNRMRQWLFRGRTWR